MKFLSGIFHRAAPQVRRPVVIAGRKYLAARPDRIAGSFSLGVSSTSADAREGLRGLVRHSRHMAQNDDYMKAFLRACRRNIIGPSGIALQDQARDSNGKLDKVANRQIEDAFWRWGKLGGATVCGRFSWLDVQNIVTTTLPRDGNVLLRLYRGREFGPYGFQVQIIDVDLLDIEMSRRDLDGGGYIEAGIECNELDRPVAYHLWSAHPGSARARRERLRVPASDIIHLFVPDEPGQMLGVPWAHTALRRLNLMHGYEEAALVAARTGAAKMGFFTREFNDDIDPDKARELTDENRPEISEVAAGEFETLPMGYDFKSFNPRYPDGQMNPFMQLMLRGAAAGLGVAYHSLANDLTGANFSSLHHGVSEERAEWRTLQNYMGEHLHERVKNAWLEMALLLQKIPLPIAKFDKFSDAAWKPRGWKAINPVDEANANQTEIESGLRSPQDVVGDRGHDLEEVYEQIAAARDLAQSYGLTFAPRAVASSTSIDAAAPPDASQNQ